MTSREDIEMLITGADRVGKQRASQRKARKERNQVSEADIAAIERQLNADVAPAELRGIGLEDATEIERAFGQDQSDLQTDFREYSDSGDFDRPDVAPKSVMQDALRRLQQQEQNQSGLKGLFTSQGQRDSNSAAQGRLEDQIEYGKVQRGAEQSLAREMMRRDAAMQNPEMRAANNFRAQAEARSILRNDLVGAPSMFDRGTYAQDMPMAQYVKHHDALMGADASTEVGTYVDPTTGSPLAVQEPTTNAIAGANTPNTGQQLNAPARETAIDFVVKQVGGPEGYESRAIPQVNINQATSGFSEAVNNLQRVEAFQGKLPVVSSNVRSIDELQRTVNAIADVAAREDVPIFREVEIDGNDGQKIKAQRRVKDPGVSDVLSFLRIGPAEQQRLGLALNVLDQVQQRGSRPGYFGRQPEGRNMEDVVFDSPAVMPSSPPGMGDAPVAQVGSNQKVGRGKNRQNVKAALARLEDPQAAMPFIGAVADDTDQDRARFIKGSDRGKGEAALVEQYGPRGAVGAELERRFLEEQGIQKAIEAERARFRPPFMRR